MPTGIRSTVRHFLSSSTQQTLSNYPISACTHLLHTFCRLKFPSVLIVYQTANLLVYDIIILIGRTDPKMLFCKSKDLLVSSTSPTPYCTLTGEGMITTGKVRLVYPTMFYYLQQVFCFPICLGNSSCGGFVILHSSFWE